MKKVIMFSGKARHGKDTVAEITETELKKSGYKVLTIHYADMLKFICKTYFGWDGEKNETGRTLLQHVGTDVIRAQEPDFWVNEVIKMLKFFPDAWDYVLIPDCRFPNEVDRVKAEFNDAIHVRIYRTNFVSPLSVEQQNHSSETALDDTVPDYTINNSGDLSELNAAVISFISSITY